MVSVLDSTLLQNNFSTAEMRQIWSDKNKLTKQLLVEATLAKIEGDLGIIPKKAAEKINEVAQVEKFDIDLLQQESAKKRHSLIALIQHL